MVFRGDPAEDYSTLHAWSTEHPGEFWAMVWDELGVIKDRGSGCTTRPYVITGSFRRHPERREPASRV